MRETAKKAFVSALVVGSVVVVALALWKLKLLIAILFFAFIIAAAMRPGIDALGRRRVPRGVGILLHYAGLIALLALLLWFVVPAATDQVREALGGDIPTTRSEFDSAAAESTGLKQEVLTEIGRRLERLPNLEALLDSAL